jgi:hypothetical protein
MCAVRRSLLPMYHCRLAPPRTPCTSQRFTEAKKVRKSLRWCSRLIKKSVLGNYNGCVYKGALYCAFFMRSSVAAEPLRTAFKAFFNQITKGNDSKNMANLSHLQATT